MFNSRQFRMMHIWAVSQSAGTWYRPIVSTHLHLIPSRWNKMEKWPQEQALEWRMKPWTLLSAVPVFGGERYIACITVSFKAADRGTISLREIWYVIVCNSFCRSLLSEQLYLPTSQSQDLLSHLKKRMQLACRNNLRLILSSPHSDLWWRLSEPQCE